MEYQTAKFTSTDKSELEYMEESLSNTYKTIVSVTKLGSNYKVNITGKDFLVVTQDNIILEPSTSSKETSEVELKLGTVLKLVPESEIPESVNERATWNNYVVYLPTRNEEGKYQ